MEQGKKQLAWQPISIPIPTMECNSLSYHLKIEFSLEDKNWQFCSSSNLAEKVHKSFIYSLYT